MSYYNGFGPKERKRKGRAGKKLLAAGGFPAHATGPCMLCGDPNVPVEPHSEDYHEPYSWEPPAVYWLCYHCHRLKLHQRFARRELWGAFLAHVRRGGYASDLKDPVIRRELDAFRRAKRMGGTPSLRVLRAGRHLSNSEWWDALEMDGRCIQPGWPKPPLTRPSSSPGVSTMLESQQP